ncbi:hypothetical protein AZE42_10284 [Rhizopogon vesiculosus]|uniref:Uncharacterized protein n=1 Tax=Rhizopogon vesiculosus TaxID=180088 RepID=A0A1J8QD77_9AGAM|nr:hypothetical protein AZE42_10284 [Rhizopogon vesiculosus]
MSSFIRSGLEVLGDTSQLMGPVVLRVNR